MKYQLNILDNGKWFLKIKKFLFWKRIKTKIEACKLLKLDNK
jgi:hypothetical protein